MPSPILSIMRPQVGTFQPKLAPVSTWRQNVLLISREATFVGAVMDFQTDLHKCETNGVHSRAVLGQALAVLGPLPVG